MGIIKAEWVAHAHFCTLQLPHLHTAVTTPAQVDDSTIALSYFYFMVLLWVVITLHVKFCCTCVCPIRCVYFVAFFFVGDLDIVKRRWLPRVEHFGYKEYAELRWVSGYEVLRDSRDYMFYCRIRELFDILVEYPDSEPALCDLKQCMLKVNLRSFLISSLKSVWVCWHTWCGEVRAGVDVGVYIVG